MTWKYNPAADRLRGLLPSGWALALKIASLYFGIGLAWILFSDRFVGKTISDPTALTRAQTYKGLAFIFVTSGLLFLGIWFAIHALRRSEEQLFLTSQGISAEIGDAFFASLVAYLARALNADCSFVASFSALNGRHAQTISVWSDGEVVENFEFDLTETPCIALEQKEICCCPSGVRSHLPADHPFSRMQIESCLAVSLSDSQHDRLGVLVVMSRRPIRSKKAAQSMLRIFAARAASELERRMSEETISRLAYFDPLTHLPNQNLFREEFAAALVQARNENRKLALLYFDFDRFKTIVRTLGHRLGNKVLQDTAQRLRHSKDDEDILAHLGGDEFVLCLAQAATINQVESKARRLVEGFQAPLHVAGHDLYVTASVGIAVFPHDGDEAETLLRNADVAMSRAKLLGRNNIQFYSSEMSRASFQSLVLENRLYRALEREEFLLLYQPQLDLSDGSFSGMEALVCWRQEGKVHYSPSDFIPLAEETGLIDPLGEWILHTACAQNRAWQDMGLAPQRVAVNVSARQFYRRDIVDMVARVLEQTRLDPRWLALEITESVLFQDMAETAVTLKRLRDLGVHLTIDDFGTGYSSLSYLQNFPLGTLKIDQSFVAGIPADSGACTITSAVIAMAHHMGMDVVAEGVENDEQKSFLKKNGCDKIQGFLFSQPLQPEDFAALLTRYTRTAIGAELQ